LPLLRLFCVYVPPPTSVYTLSLHDALPISGTINLLTGISLAYKGRAPVIVIAGDVARDYIYRDGSQAFDLVGMFKPVTSMALQVDRKSTRLNSITRSSRMPSSA